MTKEAKRILAIAAAVVALVVLREGSSVPDCRAPFDNDPSALELPDC